MGLTTSCEAMPSTTPKMPLHTPIPKEFKDLTVIHLYNMCGNDGRPATVSIQDNKITIDETLLRGGQLVQTFCDTTCFEVIDPCNEEGNLAIKILHGCLEGWKIIFKSPEQATPLALKDALLRVQNKQLMSFNLLMDDRCAHLGLQNKGLTEEENRRIREETTAAAPKGSLKQFNQAKEVLGSTVSMYFRRIAACEDRKQCTSGKYPITKVTVKAGQVDAHFGPGEVVDVSAKEFLPPRLVTPASSYFVIYVCDSRDPENHFQALAFEIHRESSAQLLEVLMHAWMEVEDAQ